LNRKFDPKAETPQYQDATKAATPKKDLPGITLPLDSWRDQDDDP
jgi:hypothetical protein